MKTAYVTLHAKDEQSAKSLEASLLNLQLLSQDEPGKVHYEIFQSENAPLDYFVRESWEDQAAFEQHINTPHLQQFGADTANWLTQPFDVIMLKEIEDTKQYIGMWVTADGHIRHELLPNNRYDEARGNRKSAYQGSYRVTGNHIDYKDDTGFTADGEFRNGILYHAGMVLYKQST